MLSKSLTSLNRSQGILSTAMYTGLGSFLGIRSFIGVFLFFVVMILVLFVLLGIGDLASAFAVLWIPFVGWGMAAAFFAAFAIIMTLVLAVLAIFIPAAEVSSMVLSNTANVTNYGSQFKNTESFENMNTFCFDEDTVICLKNGEKRKIKDIKIGDILIDGGKVTAFFKASSKDREMYILNEILVTGNHTLIDQELGVIKVKNHPNSIKYGQYYKPYVFCVNTSTKKIPIKNILFLDWDEVDEMDVVMLRQEMKDHLPDRFDLKHIHKFLESGLHPNTLIELEDGRSIPIKENAIRSRASPEPRRRSREASFWVRRRSADSRGGGVPGLGGRDTQI